MGETKLERLTLTPNLSSPDDFYEALIAAHEEFTESESAAFNARLIFILANQIGDADVLRDAIMAARDPHMFST